MRLVPQPEIVNYRYDRGYWQVIFRGSINSDDFNRNDQALICFEGPGNSLNRGRTVAEWRKRAYSRQVAIDSTQVAVTAANGKGKRRSGSPRGRGKADSDDDSVLSYSSNDSAADSPHSGEDLEQYDGHDIPQSQEEIVLASMTKSRTRDLKKPKRLLD